VSIIIRKVSKGRLQDRVTIPKDLKADYVRLEKLEINVFKSRDKYVKK
jgi:hypothetical protein